MKIKHAAYKESRTAASTEHYAVITFSTGEAETIAATLDRFTNLNIEFYPGKIWVTLSSLPHYKDFKTTFIQQYKLTHRSIHEI